MEVKVTKCENGHYYDVNKYDTCPHCGAGEFSVATPPKKRFGFFKRNTAKPEESKPSSIEFSKEIVSQPGELQCEDVETMGAYGEELQVEDVETQGVFAISKPEDTLSSDDYLTENPDAVEDTDLTTGFFAAKQEPERPAEVKPVEVTLVQSKVADDEQDVKTVGIFAAPVAAEAPIGSLQDQVRAATDDNDVKTTGYFAVKQPEIQTESVEKTEPKQPPVGWLVCVRGKNFGKDYRVYAGKNSIGRTADNGICLAGEVSVSRDKHAWVIFEPRKREFFVKPGDSSGLVYLNDENIFDTTALHSGDILELGEAKLVFVALCDQKFNWADYLK